MARDRDNPVRFSSPLRFLPRMSNFLRDQIVSNGFSFGGLFFITMARLPERSFFDELFLFFFLVLRFVASLGVGFGLVFAIGDGWGVAEDGV